MEKKKFLITGAGVIAIAAIILVALLILSVSPEEVNVITDKKEYKIGDVLKVKISNELSKSICFSSCFPYYFEKEDGNWEGYYYANCPINNLVDSCVDPKQIKAFELSIPSLKTGPHRIALPACIGCNFQETFREEQRLYSNKFIIK